MLRPTPSFAYLALLCLMHASLAYLLRRLLTRVSGYCLALVDALGFLPFSTYHGYCTLLLMEGGESSRLRQVRLRSFDAEPAAQCLAFSVAVPHFFHQSRSLLLTWLTSSQALLGLRKPFHLLGSFSYANTRKPTETVANTEFSPYRIVAASCLNPSPNPQSRPRFRP